MRPSIHTLRLCAILIGIGLALPGRTQTVHHRGALRLIMHEGDLAGKVRLDTLRALPNLYALGAVAELKGEILIWDGQPLVAHVRDGRLLVHPGYRGEAALLVYASVAEWRVFPLPDSVTTYRQVEQYLAAVAAAAGIDPNHPFPFRLEGPLVAAHWHVIDWPEGDTDHTHEKHRTSGLNGALAEEVLQVLGFYSPAHHGIFTHRSTNMHLHVRRRDGSFAAHLDDFVLGKGVRLYLPAER